VPHHDLVDEDPSQVRGFPLSIPDFGGAKQKMKPGKNAAQEGNLIHSKTRRQILQKR
jgi:hypothetical protein